MLLAYVDVAFVKLLDNAVVGTDESLKGQTEGVKAALQALDQQNLHELRQVALALLLLLLDFAGVIGQRLVARVGEVFREQANGLKKNLVFSFTELIK